MLETLKIAEQNEDAARKAVIEARKNAVQTVKNELGVQCGVSVHLGKLYGSVGSITCKAPKYSSIDKDPAPTMADIEAAIKHLPPVALKYRKGACTSIRPASHAGTDETSADAVRDIAPFTLRLNPGQYAELKLEWYGESDGELWRVSVELPYSLVWSGKLGKLELRVNTDNYGGRKVEHCNFRPVAPLSIIKWASGGSQYENEFTMYANPEVDVLAIVRAALEG